MAAYFFVRVAGKHEEHAREVVHILFRHSWAQLTSMLMITWRHISLSAHLGHTKTLLAGRLISLSTWSRGSIAICPQSWAHEEYAHEATCFFVGTAGGTHEEHAHETTYFFVSTTETHEAHAYG